MLNTTKYRNIGVLCKVVPNNEEKEEGDKFSPITLVGIKRFVVLEKLNNKTIWDIPYANVHIIKDNDGLIPDENVLKEYKMLVNYINKIGSDYW